MEHLYLEVTSHGWWKRDHCGPQAGSQYFSSEVAHVTSVHTLLARTSPWPMMWTNGEAVPFPMERECIIWAQSCSLTLSASVHTEEGTAAGWGRQTLPQIGGSCLDRELNANLIWIIIRNITNPTPPRHVNLLLRYWISRAVPPDLGPWPSLRMLLSDCYWGPSLGRQGTWQRMLVHGPKDQPPSPTRSMDPQPLRVALKARCRCD